MLVNGKQTDQISVLDRGFQYGDGLFETIAVKNGQPCLWSRHIKRLQRSCEQLAIPVPDPAQLLSEAAAQIAHQQQCVLKIVITRGVGGRGYCPPKDAQANRIVYTSPWPDYPKDAWSNGVTTRLCSVRLGNNPNLAQLKHLSRLEQVCARSEWSDPGIAEGLMLDYEGRVIEGTMSNLFIKKNGSLMTPDLSRCGVAGIMRELILDIATSSGTPISVTDLSLDDLFNADALFLTNSLVRVWPVKVFLGREYCMDNLHPVLAAALAMDS